MVEINARKRQNLVEVSQCSFAIGSFAWFSRHNFRTTLQKSPVIKSNPCSLEPVNTAILSLYCALLREETHRNTAVILGNTAVILAAHTRRGLFCTTAFCNLVVSCAERFSFMFRSAHVQISKYKGTHACACRFTEDTKSAAHRV